MQTDHLVHQCRPIQRMLRRVGYSNPVDGEDTEKTRRSIRCFQRDLRLEPTGLMDNKTLDKLTACFTNSSGGLVNG